MKIDLKQFIPAGALKEATEKAKEFVVRQALRDGVTGPEKRKEAARKLGRWLDDQVRFGRGPFGSLLELVDGPFFTAVAEALIEAAYQGLKQAGHLKEPGKTWEAFQKASRDGEPFSWDVPVARPTPAPKQPKAPKAPKAPKQPKA